MRKAVLHLCDRLNYRVCAAYTWLLRSSLKSCGKNVRFHFPVRLGQPGSISVGSGTIIYPRAWINAVSEWAGQKYNGEIQIGDRVMIGYGVQISAAGMVVIEDDVALSPGVVIVDHAHDHRHLGLPVFMAPLSKPSSVRIGKGSFLGAHSVICPGVHIGEHAVIAANSVVVEDVPSYSIATGNPARAIRFHNPAKNSVTAETTPA